MKKFFNNVALFLLLGVSTTASAQHFGHYDHPHHGHETIIINDHYGHHYDTYHHVHHYEHHNDGASAAGLLIGALVGGAIVAASQSSHNATPVQTPQQVRYNNTYNASYNNIGLQHYVNNGISYDSNESHARITRIDATPNSTTIYFEYLRLDRDYRIGLNQSIYLNDRSTNQRYYPVACDGISMDSWVNIQRGNVHEFSVTFPALSRDCHSIDLVEPNTSGWKFYHVNF